MVVVVQHEPGDHSVDCLGYLKEKSCTLLVLASQPLVIVLDGIVDVLLVIAGVDIPTAIISDTMLLINTQ